MNDKKKQERINDFFKETNQIKEISESSYQEIEDNVFKYRCPQCNEKLKTRTDECPNCHYIGYIPMNEKEIKRIRTILFFVILVIAIITYIIVHFNK